MHRHFRVLIPCHSSTGRFIVDNRHCRQPAKFYPRPATPRRRPSAVPPISLPNPSSIPGIKQTGRQPAAKRRVAAGGPACAGMSWSEGMTGWRVIQLGGLSVSQSLVQATRRHRKMPNLRVSPWRGDRNLQKHVDPHPICHAGSAATESAMNGIILAESNSTERAGTGKFPMHAFYPGGVTKTCGRPSIHTPHDRSTAVESVREGSSGGAAPPTGCFLAPLIRCASGCMGPFCPVFLQTP